MNRKLFADLAIMALRRMLPRDWDFCVVAWRMTAETELEIVLAEVIKELAREQAAPAEALH